MRHKRKRGTRGERLHLYTTNCSGICAARHENGHERARSGGGPWRTCMTRKDGLSWHRTTISAAAVCGTERPARRDSIDSAVYMVDDSYQAVVRTKRPVPSEPLPNIILKRWQRGGAANPNGTCFWLQRPARWCVMVSLCGGRPARIVAPSRANPCIPAFQGQPLQRLILVGEEIAGSASCPVCHAKWASRACFDLFSCSYSSFFSGSRAHRSLVTTSQCPLSIPQCPPYLAEMERRAHPASGELACSKLAVVQSSFLVPAGGRHCRNSIWRVVVWDCSIARYQSDGLPFETCLLSEALGRETQDAHEMVLAGLSWCVYRKRAVGNGMIKL